MKAEPIAKKHATPKRPKAFVGAKKKLDVKLNKAQKRATTPPTLKKPPKKEVKESQKIAITSLQKPAKEIQSTSKKYQKHKESDKVQKEAQSAAILSSAKANKSVANRSQVDSMESQTKDTKKFDKKNFKNKLKQQIDETIKSKDDAKKIEKNGVDDKVTNNISESVEKEKSTAGGKVESSTVTPPRLPKPPANEVTSEEPQKLVPGKPETKTSTTQKADLAPVKRPEEETDFTKETKVLDDDYQKNNLSQSKLQNSDEPKFIAADNQKQDSETKAKELTDNTRKNEAKTINDTRSGNTKAINGAYSGMLQKNATINGGRFDKQKEKSEEENKIRNNVSKELDAIFSRSNAFVLSVFAAIDFYIEKVFGLSITNYLEKFSRRVADLLDDNSGFFDVGVKLVTGDEILNEVEIFDIAKKEFVDDMQRPIDDLVDFVDFSLTKANEAIKKGKEDVDKFWSEQSTETKKIAGDIYEDANNKFQELENAVESKEGAIIDTVTEKFSAALEELDSRFEKAKIENMSWLDRAIAAVKAVINTIIDLKNAIQNVARKAAAYAERIIDDPITFFGNLSDGVGQGFTNFKNNIDKHLIKGVLEWLTGSMEGSEILLPKELNLEGITSLVLQILGISIKKIKGLVIDIIGKERFEFIEKGVDIAVSAGNNILNMFKILNEKGLEGLWEFIKEEFSDLKEMLIENVKTFVVETITQKAMEYLLSLLIPGAGFIRAAQLLIKFVVTLFQKAAQIVKIIEGIIDTFGDILNKNLSGVAAKVEMVFSGFLSLAISFLAAVLGLNGIVSKVQKFIQQKIRPKIDQVLNKIAQKIKQIVIKIGLTKLIDKSMKAVDKGKAWVEEKKKKAIEKGKQIGEKFLDFLGIKKKFKAVDGQQHTLFFEGNSKHPHLMIASDKMTFELFLNKITDPAEKSAATALSVKINEILNDDVSSISDDSKRKAKIKENQNKINSYLDKIANIASKYFKFSVLPVSKIEFESASIGGGVMGKKMLAFPLTANHPEGSKSVEDSSNPAYNKVKIRGYKKGSFYVKGHLLNNNLGGPGSWINYTPIPGALFNTSVHYRKYEHPLKKAVDNNEIFYYKVEAIYGRTKPSPEASDSPTVKEIKEAEITVPQSINLEIYKYDFNPDKQSYEKSKTQPPFAGAANEPIPIEGDGYYTK